MSNVTPFPYDEDDILRLSNQAFNQDEMEKGEQILLRALKIQYNPVIFDELLTYYMIMGEQEKFVQVIDMLILQGVDVASDDNLANAYIMYVYLTEEPQDYIEALSVHLKALEENSMDTSMTKLALGHLQEALYFKNLIKNACKSKNWKKVEEMLVNYDASKYADLFVYLPTLSDECKQAFFAWLAQLPSLNPIIRSNLLMDFAEIYEPIDYLRFDGELVTIQPGEIIPQAYTDFLHEITDKIIAYTDRYDPHLESEFFEMLKNHALIFYPNFTGELFTSQEWLDNFTAYFWAEEPTISADLQELFELAEDIEVDYLEHYLKTSRND